MASRRRAYQRRERSRNRIIHKEWRRASSAILSSKLSATEKLVLLAIGFLEDADVPPYLSPSPAKIAVTMLELGRMTSQHRVTVQRLVSRLRKRGLIYAGEDGRLSVSIHQFERLNHQPQPEQRSRAPNVRFMDL